MKYLMLVIFSLFAGSIQGSDGDYDKLWKVVEDKEMSHPQEAYKLVEQIYDKAQKEARDDQLIKAILMKRRLASRFQDREATDYIIAMEEELANIQSQSAKALYCSLLGKVYHNYGLSNQHRFRNRTEVAEEVTGGVFSTLEAIQAKAISYFEQSLDYDLDEDAKSLALLYHYWDEDDSSSKSKSIDFLRANTLEEILYFNLVNHFKDTRSLVSLPTDATLLNAAELYAPYYDGFKRSEVKAGDYSALTLAIFNEAQQISSLTLEQKIKLELIRLEFLNQHASVADKNILYEKALIDLARNNKGQTGSEAAYCKAISYLLGIADRGRYMTDQDFSGAYSKAAELILELESYASDSYSEVIADFNKKLKQQELAIDLEKVYVPGAMLGALRYRNVDAVECTVYQLDSKQYETYLNLHNSYKKVKKYLKKYQEVQQFQINIPASSDYRFHSTEFPMVPQKSGHYLLVAEARDRTVLLPFHVSNLAYAAVQGPDASGAYVMDRTIGDPIPAVKVEVLSSQYNPSVRRAEWTQVHTLVTDENGYFETKNLEQRNFAYRLKYEDDILDLRDQHYAHRDHKERTYYQSEMFTDRAIYRPGQTIHFKGLVTELQKDIPEIVAGEKLKVIFRDANWQELSTQEFTSNDYGTFHGMVTAPEGVLNGRMNLETVIGNNTYQHSIRVEEYKRPKIFAKLDKLKGSYTLGDTVILTGSVAAFSGAQVSSSRVKYRVEKRQYYWYSCGWFGSRNKSQQFITSGLTESADDGSFEIKIPTQVSPASHYGYSYIAHFDITDATGETTTISRTLNLTNKAYTLSINLPEQGFAGELDTIMITAINAEGQAVQALVDIKISSLETPEEFGKQRYWAEVDQPILSEQDYQRDFREYASLNQDQVSEWPVLQTIGEIKGYDTSTEINSGSSDIPIRKEGIALDKLSSGAYKFEFNSIDENGKQVEEVRYLFVSGYGTSALPTQALWTGTLNESYEPGETMELQVATPFQDAYLLYRIVNNRTHKKKEWKHLQDDTVIEYLIAEADRGGFTLDLLMVKNNRVYLDKINVNVPWTNKAVDIEYSSFRDKLSPGSEEKWVMKITDKQGKAIDGELTAALYDASLDQFVNHDWKRNFFPNTYCYQSFRASAFNSVSVSALIEDRISFYYHMNLISPLINVFGVNYSGDISVRGSRSGAKDYYTDGVRVSAPQDKAMMKSGAPAPEAMSADMDMANESGLDAVSVSGDDNTTPPIDAIDVDLNKFSMRENLKETVFFYPDIEIKEGEAKIDFKMNDALTKWKLLLFAHNEQLQYTMDQREIVTQKQLMIEPHLPRFVRQGDELRLNGKVTNLFSDKLEVKSHLVLTDAISGADMSHLIQVAEKTELSLASQESAIVEWVIKLPSDHSSPLMIKMLAEGGAFTDGEQNVIPVLSNKMLVTETLPIAISGGETETVTISALDKMSQSNTLTPHSYTLEFTSNPLWIVAKTIPYLTTNDDQSTIAIANSIYGNLVMTDLLAKNPGIKQAITSWKDEDLKSELSKKDHLKLSSLKETPWVRAAQSEEEQMAQLKVFLDNNCVQQQLTSFSRFLSQRQLSNGGFSWMPGGRDSWYVTQNVLENFGHLQRLGIETDQSVFDLNRAITYCDERMLEYYEKNHKKKHSHISAEVINYLYVRSFFDLKISKKLSIVLSFYYKKGEQHWKELNSYQQALLALAAQRSGELSLTQNIVSSLQDRMIRNEELGNYWNDQAGYYWYNLNIEKQALMIELFYETQQPQADIDGLKLYLLKNKQTNSWNTTKATAAACYAFLLDSENWLEGAEHLDVSFPITGKNLVPSSTSRSTGYTQVSYQGTEISSDKKEIRVSNPNKGVAWGAAYFQYFEELDKIENYQETPAQLIKEVYKVGVSDNGEILSKVGGSEKLHPGDRLRIRILLTVDRPMEFMQMKDMRSSGLEPVNVLSQYKWQDGLGYYKSTKDVATYFYFSRIPKGNYVFEYDVFAAHTGTFSNGITQLQSVYAPEFSSHSDGISLTIVKE